MKKDRLLKKELKDALNKINELEAKTKQITKKIKYQEKLKTKLLKELKGEKNYGEKK